ncbi:MAG: response regulator transcription factor [Actinobacteria bacterium]|nr:MAG: response regulator transcription factor [Actinomycetota bacterium]
MARVILAEDDEAISEAVAKALRRDGHEVAVVATGTSALEVASAGVGDLLVLDLGLPGLDGLEVIRSLREQGSKLPIIVVTARTSDLDFVVGLDAGADDYMAKPFRTDVLLARVRALVRRGSSPATIRVGELVIESAARRVRIGDDEVNLTPKEYDVLLLLSQNVGRVMSREQIMKEIWRGEWYGGSKTLDMHVSGLRRKLADVGQGREPTIGTVRGVGFRLEDEPSANAS